MVKNYAYDYNLADQIAVRVGHVGVVVQTDVDCDARLVGSWTGIGSLIKLDKVDTMSSRKDSRAV